MRRAAARAGCMRGGGGKAAGAPSSAAGPTAAAPAPPSTARPALPTAPNPSAPACADQFPEEKRERYCRKAQKLVAATLAATKFAGCPVVPVAARPGARPWAWAWERAGRLLQAMGQDTVRRTELPTG